MDFFTNENIIFYLLAFLIGSIPFGLILAKTFAGVDIKMMEVEVLMQQMF